MAAPTTTSTPGASTRTYRPRRVPKDIPRFILLCVLAVIFLAPMYWMLTTSIKTESDAIASPVQWIPRNPTLDNYSQILGLADLRIFRWFFNSALTSFAFTFGHLALCVLTAYPLARMRFKGRDAWFWIILTSLMVPGIVTLIPMYIMMLQFNWIDTYHALIWPGLPAVFGVFSFMGSWNNFVWPLFVTPSQEMTTLPVGITQFSSRYVTEYGKLMAGTAIASIPVLVAYLLAQRYLVQGIALTGMKE